MALTMARMGAPVRIQNRPVARSFAATRQVARSAARFQVQAAKVTLITPSGEEVIGELQSLLLFRCYTVWCHPPAYNLTTDGAAHASALSRGGAAAVGQRFTEQHGASSSGLAASSVHGQLCCPLSLAVSALGIGHQLSAAQLSGLGHVCYV
jgi:hypothetical protein